MLYTSCNDDVMPDFSNVTLNLADWTSMTPSNFLMEFLGGVRKLCGDGQAMEDHIVICGHEGWFSIFIG